jgi:hypothetical protein
MIGGIVGALLLAALGALFLPSLLWGKLPVFVHLLIGGGLYLILGVLALAAFFGFESKEFKSN